MTPRRRPRGNRRRQPSDTFWNVTFALKDSPRKPRSNYTFFHRASVVINFCVSATNLQEATDAAEEQFIRLTGNQDVRKNYNPGTGGGPMSSWEHAICLPCWERRNPDRKPYRSQPDIDRRLRCCFCEGITYAGIFVRHDPKRLKCGGVHADESETETNA